EAWLKCRFMREHLGEEYAGTVSAITSFGLFVTLNALYVEGLVHITELGGEYYRFDEVHQELRGERSGMRYAVGTRVRVQVSRVDLDGRRIDFRLVREGEPELPDTRQRAARGRKDSAVDALAEVKSADRVAKAGARKKARSPGTGASPTKGKVGRSAAARGKSATRTRR
ncbi:MAG: S1 RNA-binding domain-containing protein, partial [Rubrivivax sp.]